MEAYICELFMLQLRAIFAGYVSDLFILQMLASPGIYYLWVFYTFSLHRFQHIQGLQFPSLDLKELMSNFIKLKEWDCTAGNQVEMVRLRLRLRIIVLLWKIYNNGVQAIDVRDAFTVAPLLEKSWLFQQWASQLIKMVPEESPARLVWR